MSKGAPSTTTQTTRSEPWGPQQPHLQSIMNQAGQLYHQGAGNEFFPGSTVVPFSPQTEAGLSALENQAMGGAPLYDQAFQSANRAMSGFNPAMDAAADQAYGAANPWTSAIAGAGERSALAQTAPLIGQGTEQNSFVAPLAMSGFASNPFQSNIIYSANNPTSGAGIDQLSATAGGAWMSGNPLLLSQFQQGADAIRNQVGGVFNNSGMYGSAAHQNALQGGLSSLWTGLASNAYNTERGLMQDAAATQARLTQADRARALQGAGMSADLWGQDAGRRMAGLESAGRLQEASYGRGLQGAGLWGGLASDDASRALQGYGAAGEMYNQDNARRLAGASLLGDQWNQGNQIALQAGAMLPSYYQYGQMPAEQLLQAGSAREEMGSLYLNDAMQRFQFEQNAPYAALDRYRAAIGELPLQGFGSTQATTQAQRASNPLLGLLGGGAAGAGILSGLNNAGLGLSAPLGWGVMGLGALAGLLGG